MCPPVFNPSHFPTHAAPCCCPLLSPHLVCRREGDDLVFNKRVSLAEALCGTEFSVLTLDGRSLNISTKDQIIQPGSQKVLR